MAAAISELMLRDAHEREEQKIPSKRIQTTKRNERSQIFGSTNMLVFFFTHTIARILAHPAAGTTIVATCKVPKTSVPAGFMVHRLCPCNALESPYLSATFLPWPRVEVSPPLTSFCD